MTNKRINQIRMGFVWGVVLITSFLYLWLPILAVRWAQTPFPGFFLDPGLVVNSSTSITEWPAKQLTPPITYPERVTAVDDVPIATYQEFRQILAGKQVGDPITLTLIQPQNSRVAATQPEPSRTVTVPLVAFSPIETLTLFWIPYLIGLVTLAVGIWTFYMRPEAESAQIFTLFAVALAWAIGAIFEAITTHSLVRLWLIALAFAGVLNLALAAVFPHEISFVRRWPSIKWLMLLPAVVILGWTQLWLDHPTDPWAYAVSWNAAYLLNGIALVSAIGLMAYRGFRSGSPLVQQQGRIILTGAVLSFGPLCVWLFNHSVLPFSALLYLPSLIIYPVAIGYTIIRFRLLDINVVLRQGITYLLLTSLLTAMFVGIVALLSILLGPVIAPDSPVILAFFVLIVILLFNPLRDRLQAAVDQIFFRKPVEFDKLLRTYNRQLTTALTADQVSTALLNYVASGVAGVQAELYLSDSQLANYSSYGNGHSLPLDSASPFVQFVKREPGAIYLGDERTWPAELRRQEQAIRELNAAVVVPIISDQDLLGWIALPHKENGSGFTQLELNYLAALADQSLIGLERANVIRRLEERIAQVDLLSQFSQALNFTISFDDLLELVYTNCQRLLGVTDFFIAIRDRETEHIYTVFYLEQDERIEEQEGRHALVKDERVQQVILTGQMVVTEDDNGRSWIAAPLNAGAETIGALYTFYRQPGRHFNRRQEQLFSVYADRTATALDRWQTNEQLQRRAQQLETLNEIISSLTSTLEMDPLLDIILDKSIELLNTEAGTLMRVVEDTGELEFSVARGPTSGNLIGKRLPIGTGLAGSVAQSGRPIIQNNVQQDKRWFAGVDASTEFITHATLTVPLLRYRETVGVLQVINKRSGAPFNEDDQTLLTAFAGQAVVALENARLMQQTDTALQKQVNQLSLLQQLDRDLNATLDLKAVLNLTLDWILRICAATVGSILLHSEENEIQIIAMRGYSDSFDPENIDSETLRAGLVGEVLRNGKPHLAGNVSEYPNYIAANFTSQSQMTVPIIHKQRVIGAVAIESDKLNAFGDDDVETAVRVTNHAAVAIANAILYAQIIEANNAKSEFVSMVSHELKTPMTAIRGYTDLMITGVTGEVTEKQRTFLGTIAANVRRMDTLIKDLTDISRIETGHLNIASSPISFANVVSETLQTTQGLADAKDIKLNLDIPAELPLVMGDQARLVQVLTNLFSNACKYSPTGTDVYITVRTDQIAPEDGKPEQAAVVCAVRDTGYGIDKEDQARLFTKFFRAGDPNIRQSPGTGLGLSITKGIVELHNGRIWFESALGQGTTFYFSIPVAAG